MEMPRHTPFRHKFTAYTAWIICDFTSDIVTMQSTYKPVSIFKFVFVLRLLLSRSAICQEQQIFQASHLLTTAFTTMALWLPSLLPTFWHSWFLASLHIGFSFVRIGKVQSCWCLLEPSTQCSFSFLASTLDTDHVKVGNFVFVWWISWGEPPISEFLKTLKFDLREGIKKKIDFF